MAKFRVTVCLPAVAAGDPAAAIAAAMRPFDRNVDPATGGEGHNPHGEWDWYQLVSCASRGSLDLEGMRAASVAAAAATWAVWARFSAEHPPAEPLSALIDRHGADPDLPSPALDRAKAEHLAQPLVQALAQYAVTAGDPAYPNGFVLRDPVAVFAAGEQDYLESGTELAVRTAALLTLDGQWADQWTAGPLGTVRPDESQAAAYWRLADDYLRGLPDDALLAELRCHW
ncbi:hypothetical protein GCM10020229_09360 [Kitasatospora albolonga]|uniref:hypothetical protein n=1 Tax=Kitasatospora albolonga TaxID=68173 RepID=UPI0031EABB2F